MRIAIFSDLHYARRRQLAQRDIVGAALEDLRSLASVTPIDLAVFAGDLSFSGDRMDLDEGARLLLDPLASLVGRNDRVLIVPGNHDVARSRINVVTDLGLEQVLTSQEAVDAIVQDEDELARATARLENWVEFERRFRNPASPAGPARFGRSLTYDIAGIRCGVSLLNSAWRGGTESDQGRLVVSRAQLKKHHTYDDVDVRVAVLHHPLDWLAPWDAELLRAEFERVPTLVISGHLHVADPRLEITSRGGAIYCAVGCLYENSDYANSYVVADIGKSGAVLTIRTWWPKRRVFDVATDVAHDGCVRFEWPSRSGMEIPVAASAVASYLVDVAETATALARPAQTDRAQEVDDFLVEPRFLNAPYKESVAAAALNQIKGIARADPTRHIGSEEVLIVVGERETGVTSALLWLLARAADANSLTVPVYFPWPDAFRPNKLTRAISDRSALLAPGGARTSVAIAVDDIPSRDPRVLRALASALSKIAAETVVLGTHSPDVSPLRAALTEAGLNSHTMHLGPFGRKELRELLLKLHGDSSSEMLDRVLSVVTHEGLPRSPFILAALIAVLTGRSDATALNETGLLDSYVGLLLGGGDAADLEGLGLDLRRREHLLAWYAELLLRDDADGIRRLDTERLLSEHIKQLGWSQRLSAGRIIDSLISRRVLFQDDEGRVSFRHPALLHLFAAKRMEEDPDFSHFVLDDPLRYASPIKHASGLDRADAELLECVGTFAAGVVDEIAESASIDMFDDVRNRPGWADEQPEFLELREMLDVPGPEDLRFDESADRFHDGLEGFYSLAATAPLPGGVARLAPALSLWANVLRNSEIVTDLPRKTDYVKRIVEGFVIATVIIVVREDAVEEVAGRLRSAFGDLEVTEEEKDEMIEQLKRWGELLLVMMNAFAAAQLLGSVHLESVVLNVMDDESFMSRSGPALFMTMVDATAGFAGWPSRLRAVYDRHRAHPIVSQLLRTHATTLYRTSPLAPRDLSRLEDFLLDTFTEESKISGPVGVAQRAAARSDAARELRASRRNLGNGTATVRMDPLDDDPVGAAS